MKIIDENIDIFFPGQAAAGGVHNHVGADKVRGTSDVIKTRIAFISEGILSGLPEHRQIVGIYADSYDTAILLFGFFSKKMIDDSCFSIAHWRNDACQCTFRYLFHGLLKVRRDVCCAKALLSWHILNPM